MLKRFAVLAVLALSTACGNPEAGDDCAPENSLACESNTVGLSCEGGKLKAVSCRGPGGCVESSSQAVCDVTRAVAGDACPKASANTVQCEAANANRALVCTLGVWQAQDCKACAVQGGSIVCQP